MRKLILLAIITLCGISLAACDKAEPTAAAKPSASASSSAAPTQQEEPVSLDGKWKAKGFEAVVVSDKSITINIVDGDTSSLYWKGTFPAGDNPIVSIADTEALAGSMLGSQDSKKEFNIEDNQITFEITMMGTTKKIHLTKE